MNQPLTLTAAAPLIRSGELTPSELLEQCLARVDQYEPKVRAWVHLDRERARREAEQLTAEVKAGNYRGPLHGIPIGVKDIIDVFDMPTGCGSKLWANSYARRDATCVERLRQAGALILGKTVTTAYAYLDPPVTRNPWNLERTPGGSSSGSAAAVACGMCLAALGSQTGGSLTRPASYCGVCSIKPSWGRVSVNGVLPLAPTLDHIGVMANCVRDLAFVLQAVAQTAPHDGQYPAAPYPYHYTVELDRENEGLDRQLGTFPDFAPERIDPTMSTAFAQLREQSTRQAWAWQSLPLHPLFPDVWRHHRIIMAAEAASYHADRLARHPDDYPPRIRELITDGLEASAADLVTALEHRRAIRDESDAMFLDSWNIAILPAASGPAPESATTGDPSLVAPWSYLGLPTVSLPFQRDADCLPLGVQLIGREWFEDEILRAAAKLEADLALDRRLPPVM